MAEAYDSGASFAYVARRRFREFPVLERFVQDNLKSLRISEETLRKSRWIDEVDNLLKGKGPPNPGAANGAGQVADAILEFLNRD